MGASPLAVKARRLAKFWGWIAVPCILGGLVYFLFFRDLWVMTVGAAALTRATYWTGVQNGLRDYGR